MEPSKAAHLQALARGAFDALVTTAIERRVSFVVLSGDVYDAADREVSAQVRFARCLARLGEAGITVFIAHGNHDPVVSSHRPAAALPANVTVFQPGDVQVHQVGLPDATAVEVAGVSFSTAHERENLARRFHDIRPAAERCVAVLHANLEGLPGHDPYAPCSLDDLRSAPVAYWALGHVHRRTVGSFTLSRRWAYPGNLQGRSAKPSECGPKGALVVPFTSGGVGEPEFVVCDQLRFERSDVDVTEAADLGDALDLVCAVAADVTERAGGRPVLLRVRLVGATSAHTQLTDATGSALVGLLRETQPGLLGDGELVRIEVATRPVVERSQLLARGDLLAALLRRLDDLRTLDDVALDHQLAECAGEALDHGTRFVLAELRALDPTLARRVLDDVEQRFVDTLVERA